MKQITLHFKALLILSFLAGHLALAARPTGACTCDTLPELASEIAISDVIFVGQVTGVQWGQRSLLFDNRVVYLIAPRLTEKMWRRRHLRRVDFMVSKSWKGVETSRATVWAPSGRGDCGFGFDSGREYLVYARDWDGMLVTSPCSRTAGTNHGPAQDDLVWLAEESELPLRPAGSRVMGWGSLVIIAVVSLGFASMNLMRKSGS